MYANKREQLMKNDWRSEESKKQRENTSCVYLADGLISMLPLYWIIVAHQTIINSHIEFEYYYGNGFPIFRC